MKKRIANKLSGISPYIWSIFTILPFYFIFQSTSMIETTAGIILTVLFFAVFRLAFLSKRWPVYLWSIILIAISITMTILFQFIYFAFYIAFYNGNIKNRAAFLTLYIIHLVATTASINFNLVMQDPLFLKQLPFIVIIYISVILLPFNIFNKKKQEKLEAQLEVANTRIADLVKLEERQRIARDLHDTLGQKLSLIGLKSDLAGKLVYKDPEQARAELKDVQGTARTALNEVRQMVSVMRGIKLRDELVRVEQILKAAGIEYEAKYEPPLQNVNLFLENILSMCLKEAVTNVVKHSGALSCLVEIEQNEREVTVVVKDDGHGLRQPLEPGNGLSGMRERLEFVNGSLELESEEGTTVRMTVPKVIMREGKAGER